MEQEAKRKKKEEKLRKMNDMSPDSPMDPILYRAAATGDIDFFEKIPTDKADLLISKSPQENTVLHMVASQGHDRIVELVVQNCPSLLEQRNFVDDTPLHVAARGGHSSTVVTLLNCARTSSASSSTDVEAGVAKLKDLLRIKNGSEGTALHEALKSGHEQVAKRLIEFDADPELWCANLDDEERSPLYLAAEMGFLDLIKQISKSTVEHNGREWLRQGQSPVKAAIKARNKAVLEELMTLEPEFRRFREKDGRIPLHHAAFFGYFEGFRYLIENYPADAHQSDKNGSFPIHIASHKGHIDIIKELLGRCPDSKELLDKKKGNNILHTAAMSGKQNVVTYILRTHELEKLINQRNIHGYTALHLATLHSRPKIVSILTRDKRVDMKLQDEFGRTARDYAGEYMEAMAEFRERLTWLALQISRAPRSSSWRKRVVNDGYVPETQKAYKDMVNTLILVATLVATVTFSSGFQIPGGLNDQGMATMLKKTMFHVFVTCDTIAMCSSIAAVVALIWAQVGDDNLVRSTLKLAVPLLGLALTMMSLAFIASVYLVVAKLTWLAIFVLVVALVFLVGTMTIFVLFWFPDASDNVVTRYMSYYAFCLLLFATRNHTVESEEWELDVLDGSLTPQEASPTAESPSHE